MNEPSVNQQARFVIDGSKTETLEAFYRVIGEAVAGDDGYFGRNLDALDDCLYGGYGAEPPCVFVWKHHEQAKESLGYPETIRQLEKRLEQCHPTARAKTAEKLASAQRGVGETVFDWLVQIFDDADGVTLVLE